MELQLNIPLRDLLQRAIAGDYTREQLAELHKVIYVIGRRYVRNRCGNGKLPLSLFGMDEADVVHDCIAELFTRSEAGELVEISRYFDYRRISPASLPGDMLIVHLRSLVFSVVGDNIFRMLNEADPALGKIIRNIKLAVQKSDRWSLETRFDEKVLVLGCPDGQPGRRNGAGELPIPDERLEPAVYASISRHRDIPLVMDRLAAELEQGTPSGAMVPLLCLAVMIKVGFEKVHVGDALTGESADSPVLLEELKATIVNACSSVDRTMRSKYVGKGKVCNKTFSQYMATLERYLIEECVLNRRNGPAALTYFDYLREARPTLTREEYAEDHRPILEYLAKLVRNDLREKFGGT